MGIATVMPEDHTTPDARTRELEREDANVPSGPDRSPTAAEEEAAESNSLSPDTADHYEEMAERGANQKGEGRID